MPKRSVIYPTLLQVERKSKVYFDFSETQRNFDEAPTLLINHEFRMMNQECFLARILVTSAFFLLLM